MTAPRPIASAHDRRVLAPSECARLLREVGWGVLAVAEWSREGAIPIGVPTAYAYGGDRLYLAMAEGRKFRALRRNPRLCLTVTDVRSLEEWRSVAVIGRPRWLVDPSERKQAIAAFLNGARPLDWELTARDATRLAEAHLLVLEATELHGFAGGRGAGSRAADDEPPQRESPVAGDVSTGSRDAAVDAMNVLRRVVRSLRTAEGETQAALGVTSAQSFVLREIERSGTLTVGELAARTATAQSSVSEVIARLVARGLITRKRSANDHRRAAISLSKTGRTLLERAPETVQERLLAAFARLSATQQRQVADGLAAWMDEAGLGDVAATMFFEPLLES